MDRIFEYEDAKSLCASCKQILDTIHRTLDARQKDADNVRRAAKDIYDSKVISSQIETALESENINVAMQPSEKALLQKVYVCEEGEKICNTLRNKGPVQRDIIRDMNTLSSMSSPFKWLFSGRQAKDEANLAFRRLSEILQSDYPKMVSEQAEKSEKLDSISQNEAYRAVSENEQVYRQCLARVASDLLKQQSLPQNIVQKVNQFNSVVSLHRGAVAARKSKENEARTAVNNAINPMITERTLQELRNQDLDVLSQRRSGIRVKPLRDRGYRNLADIFTASQYQLASVYGISQDAARVIKYTANEIAQEVANTIKLKISSDDRTPAATALLKAVYKYDQIKKADSIITPDINAKLVDAYKHAVLLTSLNNNLNWVFLNPAQKQQQVNAYHAIKGDLTQDVINAVQKYSQAVQLGSVISDAEIWSDFSERSIEYFNLLEDVCPGAFGNDDLLYGLPEDLAREIQDQVYFPQGLKVTLRRYQEWGVKYILHQGRVLLGDEMGLGKTVQAIATMVSLRNTGANKFLVICPASVLPNWCKEIDKKSEFRSIMVHGYGRQAAFDSWNRQGGVAVTTYETLSTLKIPSGLEYDLLIVDEAHFIKNENAQRSQYVRLYGNYAKRLLYMTGTALENKVDEMISLLQVLNPNIAAQAQRIAFMSTAPQFRQMIAPVYYRRKREDVLTELPAITYSKEWCDLLPDEYAAYKQAVLAKDRSAIRKVSWVTQDLNRSAKARRLKEIIDEAESDGRKVLVFSFYLETIDRVLEMLGKRCTQPINGSVPVQRRQEIIDEFERMPAGSVLPAQIQAGGTGLNIQSASVVIICEPQLKPSIENQAISRAYRMGQTRKVLVYRLLASNTIDERIDDMLTEKQAIFDAFADISEAANATQKEEQQIDDKTFGKLIQEEIDRINAGKDYVPAASQQTARKTESIKTQEPSSKPVNTAHSDPGYQSQLDQSASQNRTRPTYSSHNTTSSSMASSSVYKAEPMVETRSAELDAWRKSVSEALQKEKLQKQRAEGEPIARTGVLVEKNETMKKNTSFSQIDDFMKYANENGVMVKDNREKGGCIWIGSDPRINAVIEKMVFGDRTFKYSAKSKALGGNPGWYY